MPANKIRFAYTTPQTVKTVGVELDRVFIINTNEMSVSGRYNSLLLNETTGVESKSPEYQSFSVALSQDTLAAIMAVVMPLALEQGVLHPATPSIEADVPPPPAPLPVPEPPPAVAAIRLLPALSSVAGGETVQFTHEITGSTETAVTYAVLDGGSVTQDGLFTAPTTPGDNRVSVALSATPEVSSVAIVTVV